MFEKRLLVTFATCCCFIVGARVWAAAPPPSEKNLAYGPHERNVMDLWLAEGEGVRPLVVYIHGGGWLSGDKKLIPPKDVERFLKAGVSVASINYRFSNHAPYPAPMRDGGLAIQFLRHHAGEFNFDAKRVGAYGRSAGAVTSMWLGFREDMADADAMDPVLRQSTRLICVGSIAGPTTLDKKTMDEWFGMKVVTHPAFLKLYDIQSEEELYRKRIQKLAADASPLNHLTADDPPIFQMFPQDNIPLPKKHSANLMVHHPLFGVKLKEVADELGVEANFETKNRPQDRYKNLVNFMITQLVGVKPD